MKTISRYIMTLALLLTAVTGAWADGKVYDSSVNISTLQVGDILIEGAQITISDPTHKLEFMNGRYFLNDATTPTKSNFQCNQTATIGANGLMTGLNYDATTRPADAEGKEGNAWEVTAVTANSTLIVGITYAPNAIDVTPGSSANTWTFAMPGSDVVLTPIYAKAAAFATESTSSGAKPLLPEAAEGVIAGTDASLIAKGTGIVAFAGTSTEVTQGTLMYAVGTSATQAPALDAFSATVPTAKDYDDAATLYVWYYIQGADAPQGVAATLDNTFDDTEPACLTVQVLTNKFDITLKAANANTIEAGKATVTVGGTDKTSAVTDGKLQGVKMGSEVKLEAKPGYKFRKVEVKKGLVNTVDLSTLTADYEAVDGDELTGTLGANVKITIADGATVTLKDLTINGTNGSSYPWAGLTPLGDATIVLEGTNTVNGFYEDYPGIFAAVGKTLTIKGDGSLTASSNAGTGIGGGRSKPCGNIVIEGGNITATGGKTSPSGSYSSAGIGGGYNTSCGNITITGGTITAKGGNYAAGIGGGGGYSASCGNITITNTVTKVTATKGSGATNSIGKGLGSCGTVTIGGVVGAISASPYTYQPGN